MKPLATTTQPNVPSESEIDAIRVEMLSTELPVHQLAKQGDQEIRVMRRTAHAGRMSLYWKVDPSSAVGAPGQLAYRLDTWVIKRRLDELTRPIPRMIRIGDLRQIARELDLGGDTNAVRRAFEQNAAAFIRAKFEYKARDGKVESVEGYFNRYNVFFRGQSLPGGARAETVYISFNDPYFALINKSVWRPLDYKYLRTLTPGAQRLYELLSPRIFAAIKNGHPSAWIRYSDFCALAVARRQPTKRRMQTQLAPIHKPHLASGYFSEVRWRAERGADGSPDWAIHYVPGPRARAEYVAFNGGGRRVRTGTRDDGGLSPRLREPIRQHPLVRTIAPDNSSLEQIARRFAERRHGVQSVPPTATQLARAGAILDAAGGDVSLVFAAVELAAASGRREPGGFPRHLGGVLEGGFVERALAERDTRRRLDQAQAARRDDESARDQYRSWCSDRAAARVARLSPEERQQLVDERLPMFIEENASFLRLSHWSESRVHEWAELRVLRRYGHEGEPAFAEWRRKDTDQTTGTSGPVEALQ
jgi:hypothetical protein